MRTRQTASQTGDETGDETGDTGERKTTIGRACDGEGEATRKNNGPTCGNEAALHPHEETKQMTEQNKQNAAQDTPRPMKKTKTIPDK